MSASNNLWLRYLPTILLCFVSCDTSTPPEEGEPTLQFKAVSVSCKETWLQVKLMEWVEPRHCIIQLDTTTIFDGNIASTDTLIVDTDLLPNSPYTYVFTRPNGILTDRASTSITTLDMTSQDFTFEFDTLGVTNSMLYDVVMINDTLAFAVGEIYIRDSSGQVDPTPYNMVKWDGSNWHFIRIQFYSICGQPSRSPYPARSIFALGPNDIWIAMFGDQVARWNGLSQTATMCLPFSFTVNKLWGENANSMYAVGDGGKIVHFNGSTWQSVESGTTLPLNDVFGGSNPLIGDQTVLIAASFKYTGGNKKILRVRSEVVDSIIWSMPNRRVHSTWFDRTSAVYASGGGVFRMIANGVWKEQPVPLYYTNRIRGNAENDIFAVGDFGITTHFNGVTWRDFTEARFSGNYESVAVKGDFVIAVGGGGGRARILRGRR